MGYPVCLGVTTHTLQHGWTLLPQPRTLYIYPLRFLRTHIALPVIVITRLRWLLDGPLAFCCCYDLPLYTGYLLVIYRFIPHYDSVACTDWIYSSLFITVYSRLVVPSRWFALLHWYPHLTEAYTVTFATLRLVTGWLRDSVVPGPRFTVTFPVYRLLRLPRLPCYRLVTLGYVAVWTPRGTGTFGYPTLLLLPTLPGPLPVTLYLRLVTFPTHVCCLYCCVRLDSPRLAILFPVTPLTITCLNVAPIDSYRLNQLPVVPQPPFGQLPVRTLLLVENHRLPRC